MEAQVDINRPEAPTGCRRGGTPSLFPLPPADLAARVLRDCGSTVPHIPAACTARWSAFFLRLLADTRWRQQMAVDGSGALPAATALVVAPPLILRGPATVDEIRRRLEVAETGDWASLEGLVLAQRRTATRPREQGPAETARRATRLMEAGAVSRAVRVLGSNPGASAALERDPETLEKARRLFPAESDVDPAGWAGQMVRPASLPSSRGRPAGPASLAALALIAPPPQNAAVEGVGGEASSAAQANPRCPVTLPDSPALSDVREVIRARAARNRPGNPCGGRTPGELRGETAGRRSMMPQGGAWEGASEDPLAAAVAEGHGDNADGRARPMEPRDEPWRQACGAALTKCGRLASPGPSGLRAEHIRSALACRALQAEVMDAWAEVVDGLCAGFVPATLKDGRLFLLPKRGDGLRPVGAGEVLRNVACRVALPQLLESLKERAEELGQWGMSECGAQRAAARIHAARTAGRHVLSVDLSNAFNCISRRYLVGAIPPSAAGRSLVVALYGGPTTMRTPGGRIELPCTRGVIQGCPLAAALFAYAVAVGPIRTARADAGEGTVATAGPARATGQGVTAPSGPPPPRGQPPGSDRRHDLSRADPINNHDEGGPALQDDCPVIDTWFADDGHLAFRGDAWGAAATYGRALERRFRDVGLEIAVGADKTALLEAENADARPPGDTAAWIRDRAAVVESLRCLGVPLAGRAGRAQARTKVEKVFHDAAATSRSIRLLQHPQHIVSATRLAGTWSRVAYITGLVPPGAYGADVQGLLRMCEEVDLVNVRLATGVHAEAVTERQWAAAGLPLRLGGLGIPRCSWEAVGYPEHISAVVEVVEREGGAGAKRLRELRREARAAASETLWRGLTAEATRDDRARLVAQADCRGAAVSWTAVPASPRRGTMVEPRTASTAIALALGCPVFPTGSDQLVPCTAHCGSRGMLDTLGHHALGCTATRGARHADFKRSTRAVIGALPRDAVFHREAHCDPGGFPRAAGPGETREGDIAVRIPGERQWLFLDHTVAGLQDDNVERASADALHVPRAAFEGKMREPATVAARAAGARRVPIAASTFGVLDPRSARALRMLGSAADKAAELDTLPGEDAPQRAIIRKAVLAVVAGGAAGVNRIRDASVSTFEVAVTRAPGAVVLYTIQTTDRLTGAVEAA